jgi:hypothetical protein
MRTFLPLLVSLALSGNYITKPPATGYGATLAPMTADVSYYADSVNGSDSNPCTSGLPCKTITHVQTLIPLVMDYDATIYLASGTYNEVLVFANLDRGLGAAKSITLQGQTWAAFTPATGPQTGTFTTSASKVATMSGAGWTSNDLRWNHIKITSGTLTGQYYPIASNTTDGMFLAASATDISAMATATFEIVHPAATVKAIRALGSAALKMISVSIDGSSSATAVLVGPAALHSIANCRIISGTSNAIIGSVPNGVRLEVANSAISTTSYFGVASSISWLYLSRCSWGGGSGAVSAGLNVLVYYCSTDGMGSPVRGGSENPIVSIYDSAFRNVTESGVSAGSGGMATILAQLWEVTGVRGIRVYHSTRMLAQLIDVTILSTGNAIEMTTNGNSIILANSTSLTSSAGYGIDLATTAAGSNSWDQGAFNNLRVGASASISGASADINLGDATTSLAALRALPGKVLVGATTLNRAISF